MAALLAVGVATAPCRAQLWLPTGIPVCQNGCLGDVPQVVPDGAGGAFIAWRNAHNASDVYLQRVTAFGLIAPGWPVDGLPIIVDPSIQQFSGLAPDGVGGALVAWEDARYFPGTGPDPFVQRIQADGALPVGWVSGGNPACLAPAEQFLPQVAPDGSGGAYVLWKDDRNYATNGYDVYAQHLTASGTTAPDWPGGGLALAALPGNQGGILFQFPDDAGGAVFVWSDGRPGTPGGYAQRVNADGAIAAGWPANGLLVTGQFLRPAARDEAGGFYVVRAPAGSEPGFDGAYYLLRFTFAGTPAPGWPAGGVLVCNAPGIRAGVTIDSDGAGGALLSWYDYRLVGGGIFAARVLADGTLAPGWTVNGTLVSDPANGLSKYDPFVLRDGQGGGYIVWQSQGASDVPSWIQHLTGSGQVATGWPQYGLRVAPSYDQVHTRIATDGQGGAIVAWDEGCCGRYGIWAQRFGPDGPTPVLASLASVAAAPDHVTLVWQLAGGIPGGATVSRRTATLPWEALGPAAPEGAERLRYEDRSVSAGSRYAYRLGWVEGSFERFSPETWVEVPHLLALSLDGFRPNPSSGPPTVAFTLPDAAPATLEAYDIAGRQVVAREVGALGPGRHQLRLDAGGLAPGVYHLRLRHTGAMLAARGLILR